MAIIAIYLVGRLPSLGNCANGPVLNSDNGHYYEYVPDPLPWPEAKVAAESLNYLGQTGYLATITSQGEQTFIEQMFDGILIPHLGQIWIGGSDAAEEGKWEWVTGTEAGIQFWQGGVAGSPVGGAFSNWATLNWVQRQPDNSGNEDFLSITYNANPGIYPSDEKYQWNDYVGGTNYVGYLVEYNGPINVGLDIKPTSCPNPLNFKSNGILQVAILGTEFFNVYDIDPNTIKLEGVAPIEVSGIFDVSKPFEGDLVDCESCVCGCDTTDGYDDILFKFDKQEIVEALGEVEDRACKILQITGETIDGIYIEGEDIMKILNKTQI